MEICKQSEGVTKWKSASSPRVWQNGTVEPSVKLIHKRSEWRSHSTRLAEDLHDPRMRHAAPTSARGTQDIELVSVSRYVEYLWHSFPIRTLTVGLEDPRLPMWSASGARTACERQSPHRR